MLEHTTGDDVAQAATGGEEMGSLDDGASAAGGNSTIGAGPGKGGGGKQRRSSVGFDATAFVAATERVSSI